MIALTLFLIAAWGWFCLVNFTDGAPLTGFLFLPLLLPVLLVLEAVRYAANSTGTTLCAMSSAVGDWERSL